MFMSGTRIPRNLREDRSKSPDPSDGDTWSTQGASDSVDELSRSRFLGGSCRQNNSAPKPPNDTQSTAIGPHVVGTSRVKSSGASSSSRKSKDKVLVLPNGGGDEVDGSADLYILDIEQLPAAEGGYRSSGTGALYGNRKVRHPAGDVGDLTDR